MFGILWWISTNFNDFPNANFNYSHRKLYQILQQVLLDLDQLAIISWVQQKLFFRILKISLVWSIQTLTNNYIFLSTTKTLMTLDKFFFFFHFIQIKIYHFLKVTITPTRNWPGDGWYVDPILVFFFFS